LVALIKWEQPRIAIARAYESEMRGIKRLMLRIVILSFVIGLSLFYWLHLSVGEVLPAFYQLCLVCVGFYVLFRLLVLYHLRSNSVYFINEEGIYINRWLHRWHKLSDVRFYADPDFADIRVLEVCKVIGGRKRSRKAYFDPSEVNESSIRAILDKYVPDKMSG